MIKAIWYLYRFFMPYLQIVTMNFIFSSLIIITYINILQAAYNPLPVRVFCVIVKIIIPGQMVMACVWIAPAEGIILPRLR